jgi:hypothetical protein
MIFHNKRLHFYTSYIFGFNENPRELEGLLSFPIILIILAF